MSMSGYVELCWLCVFGGRMSDSGALDGGVWEYCDIECLGKCNMMCVRC